MTRMALEISDLRLSFEGITETTEVLHGISLSVAPEERVALVGESGSGKSVTARAVLGLLQSQKRVRMSGRIEFEGQDLAAMTSRQRQALRGSRLSMIFQDPVSSLNPVYRIQTQFHEVLKRDDPSISLEDAKRRIRPMLSEVSIAEPDRVLESFPFQLSGGMNQRVMIAMALINEPSLLIADEPGTALDVTVQDQTLRLMRRLVERRRAAVLFISHNLGIVREFSDRIYVIHTGRIVEEGPTDAVFANPGHPYTRALLAAVPRITGGDIPEIDENPSAYEAPRVVHAPAAGVA
ncbi:MAG: ABC transporter ATP-binding protein [Rhodobacteraceae bacterium]|nr:ABC transporter ATP-binding protein [Paracoccaceae bacterium]